MAPRNKFTRGEMTEAALRVVRRSGIAALTAKALASELGTSTQPVFTCFGTMEALRAEVAAYAQTRFDAYVEEGLHERIPYFGYGKQYLRFAREEPELYRLLFLTPNADGTSSATASMLHCQKWICPSLMKIYRLTEEQANRYYRDVWLTVHSLATLTVTGGCPYSEREIEQILTGISLSICRSIKEVPGFTENSYDRDTLFRALVDE